MSRALKNRLPLLALVILTLTTHLLPQPRTVDDAFITFRYSRNLVEGEGFVYNAGERVLGTTTPLYTLIMAGMGGLLGEDYPEYALAVNALMGVIGVLLMAGITYHLTRRYALSYGVAALWALAPLSVTFAIGGMETSLHTALMLGAWFAYLRRSQVMVGVCCALGVLTRPDALLWALPLLLHQLVYAWWGFGRPGLSNPRLWRHWLPYRTWMIGLLVYLPWFFFAWAYFGNPIPQTISTKAQVYLLSDTQALENMLQNYATPFFEQDTLGALPAVLIGLFLYPTLALIGTRTAAARDSRALPILLYPWVYVMVFVAANPLIFRWYLTPPMPAYFMAIACGVGALLALLTNRVVQNRILIGVGVLALIFSLNAWTLSPEHGPETPAPRMAFHELELHYADMARTLRRDYGVDENTRLAAGDIGALGFYSRAHILDTIGLVTEGTTAYYNPDELRPLLVDEGNYVIPADLVLDWQPEFVVVMEAFIREGLAQDPRFAAQYRLVERIPTEYYGTGMLAYARIE